MPWQTIEYAIATVVLGTGMYLMVHRRLELNSFVVKQDYGQIVKAIHRHAWPLGIHMLYVTAGALLLASAIIDHIGNRNAGGAFSALAIGLIIVSTYWHFVILSKVRKRVLEYDRDLCPNCLYPLVNVDVERIKCPECGISSNPSDIRKAWSIFIQAR